MELMVAKRLERVDIINPQDASAWPEINESIFVIKLFGVPRAA